MRTLNNKEVQEVSGAGAIADASRLFGEGIGALIDAYTCRTNKQGQASGGKLGQGIGDVIEAHLNIINQNSHSRW